MKTLLSEDGPPQLTSFEEIVLSRLQSRVAAMPTGFARIVVGTLETKVRFPERGFFVTPSRKDAAAIRGYVTGDVPNDEGVGGEILVTIGEAAVGEFPVRPTLHAMHADIEQFMRVCEAVFTTRFSEWLTVNASGQIVSSRLSLQIDNRRVTFSYGTFSSGTFQRKSEREVKYEPYY